VTEAGSGRPSDRQKQQVESWFSGKGVQPHCTQCGRTEFTETGFAAVLRVIAPGRVGTDDAVPLLPLVCDYCAHIEWFLLQEMGVDV
jgi:hypothetical protein